MRFKQLLPYAFIMSHIAVITGITGQSGSYLAEFLADKGYVIYGLVRHSSIPRLDRLTPALRAYPHLVLKEIDLTDSGSIYNLLKEIKARHFTCANTGTLEIYNLGAQSHVKVSFDTPEYSTNVNAMGPLRFLEAIRQNDLINVARFYQASTSEMFGKAVEVPQNERTPFYPRSPYGVAKLYGFWIVKNYRESYGIHASNGILFNHESERRGEDFVTRKISLGVARMTVDSNSPPIELGNIDAKRDWGHAEDYIKGMWLMLQQSTPDDYVLATGETHSVREFIEAAFKAASETRIEWRGGPGPDEKGYDMLTGRLLVRINPDYYRPAEVELLIGDAAKARDVLGWRPVIRFEELVKRMVSADLAQA